MSQPIIHDTDLVLYVDPTREALHGAVNGLYRAGADRIAANDPTRVDNSTGEVVPRRYFVAFGEHVEDVTVRQHRFYRGVVLKQISEQARVDGSNWTPKAWHGALKRLLLGYEIVREEVAGRKRATVYRRLRSTADLSVRQMSEYIDAVIDTAVEVYGVEFVFDLAEREAVRWKRKPRQPKAQARQPEEATA